MSSYRDLKVWGKARIFIKDIYILTAEFPKEEIYGITSQMRRAAISIANNIVEGSARNSDKEFMRFLDYAYASLLEVENMIFICEDLGFVQNETQTKFFNQGQEIQKMIYSLKKSLKPQANN